MLFSSKHLFAGIATTLASFAFVLSGHSAEYTISDLTDIQTPNTALMLRPGDTASNATMVVRGAPYRNEWDGWSDSKSIGFLRGGVQHGYGDLENPCGNRMPGKGLWLDGGYINLTYENKGMIFEITNGIATSTQMLYDIF